MGLFGSKDISLLSALKMEHIIRKEPTNQDSIEIGTPGKNGCVKVYVDMNKTEEAKLKIERAMMLREFAQQEYNRSVDRQNR